MELPTLKASHIAVGSELTSGQTLNTNSHFLAGFLQSQGVLNNYHLIVPDNKPMIKKTLELCVPESDWVFVYGGLGPTTDDFTRDVLAEWTGLNLEFHEPTWKYIQEYLTNRNYPVREFQRQQAFFPKGATIMTNSKGTAHGFCFPWQGKMFFVLPGPPREIQSICENFLYNFISQQTENLNQWLTYTWNTIGLGESEVANKIEKEIQNYQIEVGYRVHLPYVEVKVSFYKNELQKNTSLLKKIDDVLSPILAYKQEAPFKAFFQKQWIQIPELEIQDNYTSGLLFEDFKKWGFPLSEKSLLFTNKIQAPQLANSIVINKKEADKVHVQIKINSKNFDFEVDAIPVYKLPIERQILFIKEKIYLHLLKNL